MSGIRKLVYVSIFAALTAALGFMLAGIPNIELVTFSLFVSGYLLGASSGLLVALIAIFIFYGFNPNGSSLIMPPLFITQIGAGMVIAWLGGVFRCLFSPAKSHGWRRRFALIPFALVASLCLTQIPMLVAPLLGAGPWEGWIALGLAMSFAHISFNMAVFLTGFEPLVRRLSRISHARLEEGR